MNYEQKYNEALERARGAHNSAKSDKENGVTDKITEYTIQLTETIFPELKESEGEKIRKQIISFLKEFEHDHYRCLDFSSWIAWLEKQSEQNLTWSEEQIKVCQEVYADILSAKGFDLATINSELKRLKEQFKSAIALLKKQGNNADKVKQQQAIEIPFGAKDSELQEATYHIPEGYHAEINGNAVVIKKGKQKTTWKPTEKQINAIRLARSFVTDDFGNNPTLSEVLKELEEQLKTL